MLGKDSVQRRAFAHAVPKDGSPAKGRPLVDGTRLAVQAEKAEGTKSSKNAARTPSPVHAL